MEKPKMYMLDEQVIEKANNLLRKLTFKESKEVFGKAGETDLEHTIRMKTIEQDLLFIKMIKEFVPIEKVFSLQKLAMEIGGFFASYEKSRGIKLPIQIANDAVEAINRCISAKMFKEVQ